MLQYTSMIFSGDTSSANIWSEWNSIYSPPTQYTTSAVTYASNTLVWRGWLSGDNLTTKTVITNSALTNNCWPAWSRQQQTHFVTHRQMQTSQAEVDRYLAEQKKNQQEAQRKAETLLVRHLDEHQQEELKQKGHFHLLVGDRKYRICRGRTRNIQLVDEQGKVVRTFCAHPSEMIPNEDTMLAQKLMLEHDERTFLKIANQS